LSVKNIALVTIYVEVLIRVLRAYKRASK